MNKTAEKPEDPSELEPEIENKGPNLVLLYSLLAFGLLVAMGFAAMIVWPFYLRK
jgi:hypothetical protein